ncbi:hypothetical protein [Virgibacillus phasianinus]|uniref:hypothetical protein n=1 Tax=Virgibacillus phasianinus TaxID=2017483 RepID=UPI0015604017|nr:hypothetical protein [Virgibacillus phasianinus]
MNKKVRVIIGLFCSLIICFFGVYGLMAEDPVSSLTIIPIILAAAGLIGVVANVIELIK